MKNIKRRTVLKELGANVRKLRVLASLTQEELAKRAKMHRTYIADVERGSRNVSILSAARLAKALDTEVFNIVWNIKL